MIKQKADVTTTMSGAVRSEQATLDASSAPHLIQVLTDLYSDPIKAIIREYSTNAMDGHTLAGCPDKPFKITFPGMLNPNLVFRDYGVGMSEDEIFTNFNRYGASTKRTSDDFNGMLGLGCKCAWSYADQFVVVSYHGGKKVSYSAHKDDFGVPCTTKMGEEDSDEPSGLEISIPIKPSDFGTVISRAHSFFKYFPITPECEGLSDGDQLAKYEVEEDLGHGVYVVKNTWTTTNGGVCVMGGVAYPINKDEIPMFLRKVNDYVIEVPIGSVDFTPNREALFYNRRTKKLLHKYFRFIRLTMVRRVQKALNDASHYMEALKIWSDKQELLYNFSDSRKQIVPNFKGVSLNRRRYFQIPMPMYEIRDDTEEGILRRELVSPPEYDPSATCILTGYLSSSLQKNTLLKLKAYMEKHKKKLCYFPDPNRSYAEDDATWKILTQDMVTITAKDIKNIKLDPAVVVKAAPKVKKKVADCEHRTLIGGGIEKIRASHMPEVVWIDPTELRELQSNLFANFIKHLRNVFPNLEVYSIYKKKKEEFDKEFPKALHFKEWLARELVNKVKALKDMDRAVVFQALRLGSLSREMMKQKTIDQIKDPEIVAMQGVLSSLYECCERNSKTGNSSLRYLIEYNYVNIDKKAVASVATASTDYYKKLETYRTYLDSSYPLLRSASWVDRNSPEVIEYFNLKFEAKTAELKQAAIDAADDATKEEE